ncbi:type II secretion system F family protein [Phytomonospora sp. NPDC050363]|uniref:type II secretion system F family protein n=1 Tax=Phytomonospora sp. NPDC050363 TaxID=3155642 RepID=UPI0033E52547
MILNWPLLVMMAAGALTAAGVFIILRELLIAPTPALGPALKRLHHNPATPAAPTGLAARIATRWKGPSKDLRILQRSPEQHVTYLLISGLIGFLLVPLLTFLLLVMRLPVPIVVPAAAAPLFAIGLAYVTHRDLVFKAAAARSDFRRATCVYIELVGQQIAAARGPVQALEAAARGCDSWVFDRINDALQRGQSAMGMPWDELRTLAADIDLPEIDDLAQIMQSGGQSGAPVYESLRARADSLRAQIRADDLRTAKAKTTKLDMPGAALVFVLLGFVTFPIIARLLM